MRQQPEILFLYANKNIASQPSHNWRNHDAGGRYEHYSQDGYFQMFEQLLGKGIISKLTILFESRVEPGKTDFIRGAESYVIPRFDRETLKSFIGPDTIIFCLGVSKHWIELLKPYKGLNWLILYGANTGKERWSLWDILFDDLSLRNAGNRFDQYSFPFIQPINEHIFKHKGFAPKFDICIGASNIHDEKGQYKVVKLLKRYAHRYGSYPKCVMPGYIRRSLETTSMCETVFIKKNCVMPGRQNRCRISDIMNQSKIFIHLGTKIQNDMSLAEAWACGCKLIFAAKHRFSPYFVPDGKNIIHFKPDCVSENSSILHDILNAESNRYSDLSRQLNIENYKGSMGFQEMVMPRIELLFKLLASFENGPCIDNRKKLPIIMQSEIPLLFKD